MKGWRLSAVVIVTAVAVVAVSSAASAPQAVSYSRLAVGATFHLKIDYGSNPDSVFNGTYRYSLRWNVNTIAVYDGRRVSALSGSMLAEGGAQVVMDMTEWRGPSSRRPVRCPNPGSDGGGGQIYHRSTNGGRFSGGGGVGVANGKLSINPGQAIAWSIGCAATEGLATHGLTGGPAIYVSAPSRSRFAGAKAFSISCSKSHVHGWDPAAGVPNAHTFEGIVSFDIRFTPFPTSQLTATKKRLRDLVGKDVNGPNLMNVKTKKCS